MWSQFFHLYLGLTALLGALCLPQKIRFMSTEHPRVTYINHKYVSFANLTSQRFGRYDPVYYVGLHVTTVVPFDNAITIDFYFYEFLTNRYKRSFVEMHFKFCDLIQKDQFFGAAMRQGKLVGPCPYPPGDYHMYNMTIPSKLIPLNFPFSKGRIIANVTCNNEHVALGHIDMEIKEVRLRTKNITINI